jgi:haloalkane dehalogenase
VFDEGDWLALPESLRAEFPWPPQRLALDSGSLAHVEAGAGQPVLMLHGNPTWSFLYRHLIGSLCSDFHCLAPDYAGFGRSKAPAGFDFTPRAQARLLERWFLAQDLKNVLLMVQDWGGPIGLWLAARHPRRFAGLVIGNTWAWPVNGDLHFELFSRLLGGRPGAWAIRRYNLFVERLIPAGIRRRKVEQPVMDAYRLPFRQPARRLATSVFPREIVKSRAFLTEVRDGLQHLRQLDILIVWGDCDPAFRTRERRRFEQVFPGAETVLLPGAGHFIQEDAPFEIAEAIRLRWAAERIGQLSKPAARQRAALTAPGMHRRQGRQPEV